jgi:hypothetical protein
MKIGRACPLGGHPGRSWRWEAEEASAGPTLRSGCCAKTSSSVDRPYLKIPPKEAKTGDPSLTR